MKHLLIVGIVTLLCTTHQAFSQCNTDQNNLVVQVFTDAFPYEISWEVKNASGAIVLSGNGSGWADNTLYQDSICIDTGTCYTFGIHDSYGDGICCTAGMGYYKLLLDGVEIATGGDYGSGESFSFNCPPGESCATAFAASTGNTYTALTNDTWYTFTPDSLGMYTVSTCSGNTCNTVIWIYDHCMNLTWDNTNAGTVAYNDDACGSQAQVDVALESGETYFIRIGSASGNCTGEIHWSLNGPFPIYGCMDPAACNYQPLATVDSGGCIYPGNPNCPLAPDLLVNEDEFINTLQIGNVTASNCDVQEECLMGFGNRRVINFTTHIMNIGELDYYIGDPTNNPDQFTLINCHNHPHYEGYAEYLLYDENGAELPIGFKNGFCVIDLECSGGGFGQYSCNNMGITAGCGDIYSNGLSCQWIDITDVDTGTYTMVIRVNWDQSPDALGRIETTYSNNWAQACITIYETGGVKNFTLTANCNPFVDCAGVLYGDAQPDCNGVCNGTAMRGDLDNNSLRNLFDINAYMSGLLNDNLDATPCNDLFADGEITVYEAALLNDCTLYGDNYPLPGGGYHNYCSFPAGIYNFNDTVTFKIAAVNNDDQYVDIHVLNPDNDINAYEFTMHGLTIENVVTLADPADYPAMPQFINGGVKVACYSTVDSSLSKLSSFQPLCRIYYSTIADTVCIDNVIDVINQKNQRVAHKIDNCVELIDFVSGVEASNLDIVMHPNPTIGELNVSFNLPAAAPFTISVTNPLGQVLYSETHDASLVYNGRLNLNHFASGTYLLQVHGATVNASRKIVVVR